ncbi:MAG: PorP/SprF family type IX secretion system membrane protein [Bacteroidota bacterium]
MKRIFLLPFIAFNFLFLATSFAQQDVQYNLYMFNPLVLNPATAGSRNVLSSTLQYREQWTGIKGAPSTASLVVQMPFQKKKIGVGIEILSNKQGPERTSAFLFSYAYRIRFLKGKLSFGLRTGIYNYVINWDEVNYKDQMDASVGINRSSKITGTGDFGIYYYTRTFYWGLSANHLNRGEIITSELDGSTRQAMHTFMAISKAFEVNKVVINPTLLVRYVNNAPPSIDLSLSVLLKECIWLGSSYKHNYGVALFSQYLINDKLKVGYSYDMGFNKIGTAGRGSHEIIIEYNFNVHGAKIMSPRYF